MIIYKTTNLINNKIYIGQNSTDDEKYIGSGFLLIKAIKKYGIENFMKEIIEECDSKEKLNEREKYWINFYNSRNSKIGYNIAEGGTGGKLLENDVKKGKTYEEYYGAEKANELKKKFSEIRKGKKRGWKNITPEETGKKISKALKGNVISQEQKNKISKTLKNFYKTEKGKKYKNKLSELNKNKKLTDDHKNKIKKSMIGYKPKKLNVHPSAKYWYFYDSDNNLILETLGDRTKKLKDLKTNQKRIIIFDNIEECLNYNLPKNKDFKVFTKKYYIK